MHFVSNLLVIFFEQRIIILSSYGCNILEENNPQGCGSLIIPSRFCIKPCSLRLLNVVLVVHISMYIVVGNKTNQ